MRDLLAAASVIMTQARVVVGSDPGSWGPFRSRSVHPVHPPRLLIALLLLDHEGSRRGPGGVWGRPGEASPGGSSQGVEEGTPGEPISAPDPKFS